MRVNVYAEEMTDRIEIVEKEGYTGVRFYLELPVTTNPTDVMNGGTPATIRGPFIHRLNDDDTAAVTFWGKGKLKESLEKAISMLEAHKKAV